MRAICASRGRVVSTAGAWPRTSSSSEMWRARSRRWPLRWQLCRRAARRADRGAATLRPGRARERLSWIARHTWHRPLPRVGRHVRARAAAKKAIPRVIPASTHELKDGPCTNASQQADSSVTCCPHQTRCRSPAAAQAAGCAAPKDLAWAARPLLELWDGVCAYFAGQAKPAAWLDVLLRALRLVSPEARGAAAAAAQVPPRAHGQTGRHAAMLSVWAGACSAWACGQRPRVAPGCQ